MSLDAFFRIGETIDLGSHTFEAEAIKAFARKYDPQLFHVDEEAAKKACSAASAPQAGTPPPPG